MTIQIATLAVLLLGAVGAVVWLSRSRAKAVQVLTAQVKEAQQGKEDQARASRELLAEQKAWEAQQARKAQARYEGLLRALRQLVGVDLPAALRGEVSVAGSTAVADEEVAAMVKQALDLASAAAKSAAEERESVRLAVVALARRVQVSAHRSQQYAVQMSAQHPGDPGVGAGCMRLDHLAGQQARQAASVAVLCGEFPGQQWTTAQALVDVAQAGSGRIEPYSRVDVVGDQTVAVVAEAAEGLIHVLAELLANAAQSSPPNSRVRVRVSPVGQGAVFEIDDCGAGVTEHRLSEMRAVMSGSVPRGIADLGEVPQTGLAVVGEYVRRLGLHADLQESVYGGLRAVVRVPKSMVTVVPLKPPAGAATNGRGLEVRTEAVQAGGLGGSGRHARESGGLPSRRSRRGEAVQPGQAASPSESVTAEETPSEAGEWMNSYFAAGKPAADSSDEYGQREY
ncbi:ATP-binding protein [Streptomyces sp. NPDC059604]|uniref:ATP-binding protein n=1 Tax=Streptomyces sp. NPDC059604 TaxID=3346881 RepID=UPI0036C2EA08